MLIARITIATLIITAMTLCCPYQEVAELTLQENPTTGYVWTVKTDPSITIATDFYTPRENKFLVGAGGYRTFVFEPTKDGRFHITLLQQREWESEPISKIEYDIEVRNGKIIQTYAKYKNDSGESTEAEPLTIHRKYFN